MKEYEQASMFDKLFKDLAADTKKSYHGLRNLASHEATAAIDTTLFAETSDYNVVHTGRSVEDGLSGSLKTANMILCMLSQTSAGGFFNKGSYIANVDEVKCHPAEGGGGGGGGGGGSGQSAAPKRQITPWTVIATGPNATTPEGLFEISAWLEIGPPDGKINLEFKMEVREMLFLGRYQKCWILLFSSSCPPFSTSSNTIHLPTSRFIYLFFFFFNSFLL